MTSASISGIEKGEFNPSAPLLVKIAAALENVSVEDLVEGLPLAPAPEENALEQILEAHGVETRYLADDTLPDRIQDMDRDEALAVQHDAVNELGIVLPELFERWKDADHAGQAAIRQEKTEIMLRANALRWAMYAKFHGDPEAVEELKHALARAR